MMLQFVLRDVNLFFEQMIFWDVRRIGFTRLQFLEK